MKPAQAGQAPGNLPVILKHTRKPAKISRAAQLTCTLSSGLGLGARWGGGVCNTEAANSYIRVDAQAERSTGACEESGNQPMRACFVAVLGTPSPQRQQRLPQATHKRNTSRRHWKVPSELEQTSGSARWSRLTHLALCPNLPLPSWEKLLHLPGLCLHT